MRRVTGHALSRYSLLGYVRGLGTCRASRRRERSCLLLFSTLHYRMYYIFRQSSGSYGQSFLASGDLKTRLMLRARSIDLSIYKIYTRARENGLNGRNGIKNHPLSIVKRNGTGNFFLTPTVCHPTDPHNYTYIVL